VASREPIVVRSYRAVVDDVERRIYRIDRWRLPLPGGVEVRAIVYAVAAFAALAVLDSLPLAGQLLDTLPVGVRYLALPVLAGWGLAAWRIDGRAPHRALWGACRFAASPRTLSGRRRTLRVGEELLPVGELRTAPSGDEAAYRRGRVRGPALVVLRYPARLASANAAGRRELGDRVSVEPVDGGRPLIRGRELRVPAGGEVRFR
jgi:hypothetical protein